MDDQPSASAAHQPLTIDRLIALEPRFGRWLDAQAIPPEQRDTFLKEGWVGQFYAEAVMAGTANELGPFLAALVSASAAHPPLTIDHLIALEPRFGAWLDARGIPPDERATFLKAGWPGQFYAEAVIAGTTTELGLFLAAIDAEVFRLKQGYGWGFVQDLDAMMFKANTSIWYALSALPPTLLLCWHEWSYMDQYYNNYENFTYGKYEEIRVPYNPGY